MARIRICREDGCHNAQTTAGYCRVHYLKNWKRIKKEQQERAAKRLNRYIEAICRKHPKKYIEVIKEDINTDRCSRHEESSEELDELYRLFNESTYEEDVERLIKDLKIEKDF